MSKNSIKTTAAATMLSCMFLATVPGTAMAGPSGNIDEVEVGQTVAISGLYLPGGMIVATEVEVANEPPPPTRVLSGNIESLDAENQIITMMGTKIMVGPETQLELGKLKGPKKPKINGVKQDRDVLDPARPLKFSDLEVGKRVDAEGVMNEDGSLDASEIQVKRKMEVEVQLEGAVDEVDIATNRITVMGFKIMVNRNTIIQVD